MNVEELTTLTRTLQNYCDNIHEFLKMFGPLSLKITELIAHRDKEYAHWEQIGKHLSEQVDILLSESTYKNCQLCIQVKGRKIK